MPAGTFFSVKVPPLSIVVDIPVPTTVTMSPPEGPLAKAPAVSAARSGVAGVAATLAAALPVMLTRPEITAPPLPDRLVLLGPVVDIDEPHPVITMPDYLVDYRLTPGGLTSQNQWRMLMQFEKFAHNLKTDQTLDFDSFQRHLSKRPLTRLRIRWDSLHKKTVRYGAYHMFNGRRAKGLLFLVFGVVIEPHHGLEKLMRAHLRAR